MLKRPITSRAIRTDCLDLYGPMLRAAFEKAILTTTSATTSGTVGLRPATIRDVGIAIEPFQPPVGRRDAAGRPMFFHDPRTGQSPSTPRSVTA